ncbi:MAG: hypothetical protein IKJ59_09415 [Clostridia bacterium]|nr:hypothetical protein [Clostridia bacterium]
MKKSVLVFLHFVFCVFLLLSPLQLIGNNQDDRPLPSLAELIGEPPLIELAEENLPLYVTYLRLNQKEPIRDCELMGGFGIITSYADSSYCCKFETLFLIGEGLSKPSDLFYISQEEGPILTSKIQWKPIQQYGIDRAVTEFELPSDEELSSNQLLISLDGKNWYSYLVVNNDLAIFFVRQSALPMEVNNDGYPIRKWEKLRNNMRREISNQPRQ